MSLYNLVQIQIKIQENISADIFTALDFPKYWRCVKAQVVFLEIFELSMFKWKQVFSS